MKGIARGVKGAFNGPMLLSQWFSLLMVPIFFLQLINPQASFVRTLAQPQTHSCLDRDFHVMDSAEGTDKGGLSWSSQDESHESLWALHVHSALPLHSYLLAEPPQPRKARLHRNQSVILNFPSTVFQPPKHV